MEPQDRCWLILPCHGVTAQDEPFPSGRFSFSERRIVVARRIGRFELGSDCTSEVELCINILQGGYPGADFVQLQCNQDGIVHLWHTKSRHEVLAQFTHNLLQLGQRARLERIDGASCETVELVQPARSALGFHLCGVLLPTLLAIPCMRLYCSARS